jgi:hypothetical protein
MGRALGNHFRLPLNIFAVSAFSNRRGTTMTDQATPKTPPPAAAPRAAEDLSREIEKSVEREPDEHVRTVRLLVGGR